MFVDPDRYPGRDMYFGGEKTNLAKARPPRNRTNLIRDEAPCPHPLAHAVKRVSWDPLPMEYCKPRVTTRPHLASTTAVRQ